MIAKLCRKHREVALYLFFGGATTALNFVVYVIASFPLGLPAWLSTIIAWFFGVCFAFVTNRKFVFASKAAGKKAVMREVALFFTSRVTSGAINTAMMYVLVDRLNFHEIAMFTLCQIFVIVFNYVASKWLIFNKK